MLRPLFPVGASPFEYSSVPSDVILSLLLDSASLIGEENSNL